MPVATQPPSTDLFAPLPEDGAQWDPHTVHTHYFGFSVPAAQLGAFIYIRYQPAFPLCQGGVCIYRGLENRSPLDMEFLDYEITMPWPRIDHNSFNTANGLRIEFLEPGREARLTYTSNDGATSFDLVQTAVTPLLARGHVMPGEDFLSDPALAPGGSEQMMHCRGNLVLHGEPYAVDCYEARDRSWNQVRTERQGAVDVPPVGWSPVYFGEDLIFNQVSFEAPDTDPAWKGIYDVPADRPTHHYAWVYREGAAREVTRVRRNVLEHHPTTYAAMKQEIEAQDEDGRTYRIRGESIAMTPVPTWPNCMAFIHLYRWEDEQGRIAYGSYQEAWFDRYQRGMKKRALASAGA